MTFHREGIALESKVRQLLEELSEKLSEVLAESPDVGQKLDQVKNAGYSVFLLLDCKRSGSTPPERPGTVGARRLPAASPGVFRINAKDVKFLRSVGIDPTRPGRRRKDR